MVGFVPSPVNLETILIRREVQARKAAKALAKYAQHATLSVSFNREWLFIAVADKSTVVVFCNRNDNLFWSHTNKKQSIN